MRKPILIMALLFGITVATSQVIYFDEKDELYGGLWVDPTFTDRGAQLGAEITLEMYWGFVRAGMSRYEALNPGYTDFSVIAGTKFHLFSVDRITYSIGPRGGLIWRDGNSTAFPMMGVMGEIDFNITRNGSIRIGLRAWADYCADQDPSKYGGHTSNNILIKDPMFRENGAIFIKFRLTKL